MTEEIIAKAIFAYLKTNSIDMPNVPYSYAEHEDALTISVDGEIHCKEVARAVLKAIT